MATNQTDEPPVLDLRFVDRRRPSAAETAAVIAVVAAAVEQCTPEVAEVAGTNDWVRSGGAIRRPIETGPGRWQRSLR